VFILQKERPKNEVGKSNRPHKRQHPKTKVGFKILLAIAIQQKTSSSAGENKNVWILNVLLI